MANPTKRIADIEAKLTDTWWLTIQRDDTEWLICELRSSQARLARACELLRDALWNLREADRAHLAEPISAFLAGEAK